MSATPAKPCIICVAATGMPVDCAASERVRVALTRLAPSNTALVRRVVDLSTRHGRPVATPAPARATLGLTEGGAA